MRLIDAIRHVKKDFPHDVSKHVAASLGIILDVTDPTESLVAYHLIDLPVIGERIGIRCVYALYFKGWPVGSWEKDNVKWIDIGSKNMVREYLFNLNGVSPGDIFYHDEQIPDEASLEWFSRRNLTDGLYQGKPARALVWYVSDRRSTPLDERRGDQPYFINVPRSSDKDGHVAILCEDEEMIVPFTEFSVPLSLDSAARYL